MTSKQVKLLLAVYKSFFTMDDSIFSPEVLIKLLSTDKSNYM